MRVLIFGVGYVGLPLAQALSAEGVHVVTATSKPARVSELTNAGFQTLVADITNASTLHNFPVVDVVVNLVSSSGGGPEDYHRIYVDGTRNLLHALPTSVSRFVQASSTSVYAQDDGEWVDEDSPTSPEAATGQALVAMEQMVRNHFKGIVLRISGIYGPGRGHLFKQFVAGQARITGKPERHLNMVHRDDIVTAFQSAVHGKGSGNLYNITDDEPVRQTDFYHWLAAQLNKPIPPRDPSESPRKRGVTDKCVSNRKARHELGWTLRYPTFREGFAEPLNEIRNSR
ncbi:MAG TPA: SDR family oxidoreductase [Methylomirabilota bacterium]|nr:SDR family oxidoreductase [Methylomirabilota bacterium]